MLTSLEVGQRVGSGVAVLPEPQQQLLALAELLALGRAPVRSRATVAGPYSKGELIETFENRE